MKTTKDINYSFKHFQERLLERHELDISREEYDNLNDLVTCKLYKDGPARAKTLDRQEVVQVQIKLKDVLVTYDTRYMKVTTVLP